MDKHARYREIVIQTLREKEWDYEQLNDSIKARLVSDTVNDHYLILVSGWKKRQHINRISIQIDIIDGKIWLQHNMTEHEIADELMAAGVPASDIVLGFVPEDARIATGFATI